MEEREIYEEFKKSFFKQIYKVKNKFSDYVFLCIGTNKITGDSFGPFVGNFLLQEMPYQNNIHVIGNMNKNISYLNAEYNIKKIYKKYKKPCVIAIDSALSNPKNVGKILVTNSKIKLGEGVGKRRQEIGNISIKGIVAKDYSLPYYNFYILKLAPKEFVINLAKITAKGICEVNSYIK